MAIMSENRCKIRQDVALVYGGYIVWNEFMWYNLNCLFHLPDNNHHNAPLFLLVLLHCQ